MAHPPIKAGISELASLLKPRYPKLRDPGSFKARRGFRNQTALKRTPPLMRHPKRGK
jgi:hypothetical protein